VGTSEYLHLSHNVSVLLYHFVCPTKYRRVVFDNRVEESLKQICEGIELGYCYINFLEVGVDKNHVHYLIQSTPDHKPSEIIRVVKSITARRIFSEHPEVKKKLWGGNFWSEEYFVSTVERNSCENAIAEYVRNQGKKEDGDYEQLVLKLGLD